MGMVQVGRKGLGVMKVLTVCSFKRHLPDQMAPFVKEQVEALRSVSVGCDYFLVQGEGFLGYLRQLKPLKDKIRAFQPDVVHAHFGLCGLLANLQRKVPVVTTYHGSDINNKTILPFSRMAIRLSAWNVFVSRKTMEIAKPKKKYSILPCGIELSDLQLMGKAEALQRMGLSDGKRYILFAGAFDNTVKNVLLAKETVALLCDENVELLELKGYSREEVIMLMCAADALLMTSLSEGSPQVLKEAMACGCPIISVDVGDARERMKGIEGCYVAQTREPQELAELLRNAFEFGRRTNGREKLLADGLDNQLVARRLVKIYENVLK